MVGFENRLFCSINHNSGIEQEQQRLQALNEFSLLNTDSVPIFEEAVQMAAHFLEAPIVILGVLDSDRQWFKATMGLSRIGLMNDLATSRQLNRSESLCTHVVEQRQVLVVNNLTFHLEWQERLLVRRYGIRAYLGVPLMTADQVCLGALEVMELQLREFTQRDVELLEMTGRWCMSEFERNHLKKTLLRTSTPLAGMPPAVPPAIGGEVERGQGVGQSPNDSHCVHTVKTDLIVQMTQELRTPLTSILGMASVLNREIYGPLTEKQKEYMDIVHNSGQYLLTLVNEILELGTLDDDQSSLSLSPVDVEMVCQQILAKLQQVVQRRDQQLHLTIEPGPRIWLLDKEKVRQMLYHLLFSVIQSSSADSTIRLHISRKRTFLTLTLWTSHPWLGDGLPQAELNAHPFFSDGVAGPSPDQTDLEDGPDDGGHPVLSTVLGGARPGVSRRNLGLLLSRRLAAVHGGGIAVQGSLETGYRYVVSLPQGQEVDPVENG